MTSLVSCQLLLLYHFYSVLNSHLFIWRQVWFYVLSMVVKCYFEMQMKLWLRDVHGKSVVYEVTVWKQVQGEMFCGPIQGLVMYCWRTTQTGGGHSRTRRRALNSSAIHDIQTWQTIMWSGVLTVNHTSYTSWIPIPYALQLPSLFRSFEDIAYSFLEIMFLSV